MIGIAGIGGIGSNIAANLVRSGIGPLRLVDMDCVEQSNLNRQFYFADQIGQKKVVALKKNLHRIGTMPQIEVCDTTITQENCAEIFAGCTIIVEGLDNEASKKTLIEEMAAQSRLIVSASGIAGPSLKDIDTRRLGNCIIVGDFTTSATSMPLYAHKLQAICAQMTEILIEEML